MSNNHNNIYSILGKLESLTPKEQPVEQAPSLKEYANVPAKGSIIAGVKTLEETLNEKYMGFKKTVSAIEKGGSARDPEAVAAAIGREKYGKAKFQKAAAAGKKLGEQFAGDPNIEKVLDAVAKIYQTQYDGGDEIWDADWMQDWAHTLMQANPTDQELDFIIANGHMPNRLVNVDFPVGDDFQFGESKVCAECGMHEGSCQHTKMEDGEPTHKGGEKVATKTGMIHKSKATVDTEKELSRGDVPDLDADDEPKASTEKKGRGRPKKAEKDRSQARMPWGGKPPKASAHKLPDWPKEKTRVHKMVGESTEQIMSRLEKQLTESRLLDETGEALNHILNRFRHEVRNFEQGGDLDKDLYDALFDYYLDSGEIPYGIAKARTGDPYQWVAQNLESHLRGGGIIGGNQEEDPLLAREAGIPGNIPTEHIPGKEELLKGKGRSYYEEEMTMEDELNELARLAGLNATEGNAFTGKLASTPKGGEFELDGKTFKDTSDLDETELEEDDMEEGNEFSGELAKARAQHKKEFEVDGKTYPVKESTSFDSAPDANSQFNISTSMSSDGNKNVTVTATGEHAAGLLQMLRIAGLGDSEKAQELQAHSKEPELVVIDPADQMPDCGIEMDEDGIDVDQPATEPANAPNEKYGSIKNITTQGDDLNREKTQDPYTANKAANPMTNARDTLKAVAQLESKLAAEYESIKKISK